MGKSLRVNYVKGQYLEKREQRRLLALINWYTLLKKRVYNKTDYIIAPPDVAMTKLHAELGDVLWHIAEVCTDNGWKLEDVMEANITKLESRKLRNVIMGAGDDR